MKKVKIVLFISSVFVILAIAIYLYLNQIEVKEEDSIDQLEIEKEDTLEAKPSKRKSKKVEKKEELPKQHGLIWGVYPGFVIVKLEDGSYVRINGRKGKTGEYIEF